MQDFTEVQREILQAVSDFLEVSEQDPLGDSQIYGCDCGCGGEVDSEELDSYYEAFDEALKNVHNVFEKHNVG